MGFYPGALVKNALADIGGGLLQLHQTGILLVMVEKNSTPI